MGYAKRSKSDKARGAKSARKRKVWRIIQTAFGEGVAFTSVQAVDHCLAKLSVREGHVIELLSVYVGEGLLASAIVPRIGKKGYVIPRSSQPVALVRSATSKVEEGEDMAAKSRLQMHESGMIVVYLLASAQKPARAVPHAVLVEKFDEDISFMGTGYDAQKLIDELHDEGLITCTGVGGAYEYFPSDEGCDLIKEPHLVDVSSEEEEQKEEETTAAAQPSVTTSRQVAKRMAPLERAAMLWDSTQGKDFSYDQPPKDFAGLKNAESYNQFLYRLATMHVLDYPVGSDRRVVWKLDPRTMKPVQAVPAGKPPVVEPKPPVVEPKPPVVEPPDIFAMPVLLTSLESLDLAAERALREHKIAEKKAAAERLAAQTEQLGKELALLDRLAALEEEERRLRERKLAVLKELGEIEA